MITLCAQALDEEYLKVDAQFGGVDQRKIFTLAEKVQFSSPHPLSPCLIVTTELFSFVSNARSADDLGQCGCSWYLLMSC